MPHDPPFAGLDPADGALLAAWLARVRPAGIDAAVDFSSRCWNVPAARTVIGVFRSNEKLARWLIAWHNQGWLLLRPHDGFALEAPLPMPEVLAMIETSRE